MHLAYTLPFCQTKQFHPIFLDYVNQKDSLKDFYGYFPIPENFEKQINLKAFDEQKRKTLVDVLHEQYKNVKNPPTETINLLLQPTTFTITTGHQLNIYTGTLYFHYKIQTVIRAAQELKKRFPSYDFVPLYWQASEDHDLAEIQYFNLFGKKYEWQTAQTGAVGRMHTQGLAEIATEINEKAAQDMGNLYANATTLAEATRNIVHHFYQNDNLIILDADDKALKKEFVPYIKKEVFEQPTHQQINQTNQKLDGLGYRTQIHAREINFFYLDEGIRERIVRIQDKEGNDFFEVLNTHLRFSASELAQLIENEPEKFSPNVALRPLYQEVILPNLSYTGGPGELAYWLQLKTTFEAFDVPFPILLPRNFVLILPKAIQKKIEKTGLTYQDLFEDFDKLRIDYVKNHASEDIELAHEKSQVEQLFSTLLEKGKAIDSTLEKSIAAEQQKMLNGLDNLAKRLRKAEENSHQVAIKQIEAIKDKLFPNGSLQERYDNFMTFYLNNTEFLNHVQTELNPFLTEFLIFEE